MKKIIGFLLALAMVLPLAACGGDTAAESTEVTTVATTEAPAQEEYVAYELAEGERYEEIVRSMGFVEFYPNSQAKMVERANNLTGAYAIPTSLEVRSDGFRMELDCGEYVPYQKGVQETGDWVLYGGKGTGPDNISDLDTTEYTHSTVLSFPGTAPSEEQLQQMKEECSRYYQATSRLYHKVNEVGAVIGCYYWSAIYFPDTGNLYNLVRKYDKKMQSETVPSYPWVFLTTLAQFNPVAETLRWGDFSVELREFAIKCGSELYIYQYRPGMSLSDWACSELNVDGWIPWYNDEVLSPDRAYSCSTGYLDMKGSMEWYGFDNILFAEEYDGETNHLNNGNIAGVEIGPLTGMDSGRMSEEELQDYLEKNGDHTSVITAPEGTTQDSLTKDSLMDMMSTEEGEIAMKGNISAPVAHMVNARTPLFTPGFRIVSKENGRAAYHSVEMTTDLLLDDIIDIYMNGIDDELIPHIKLYAFPESEKFMATLEGHTIFNAHPTPLEQGDPMLTIPEDAVCLTFQRVRDGQEAPNSPNPLKPGHDNLNENAVFARYVTKDDPNFGKGVNLVFAITFDDELVYWIHMGANFYDTYHGESLTGGMRY